MTNKGNYMTPQAFLLRQAKQHLGKITWATLAERIGIKERALKSYLADESNANFRLMPEDVYDKLENLLKDFGSSLRLAGKNGLYMPTKKVISVSAQKGGVGKTTIVASLAAIYARMGYKVLVIDMDPQANLTEQYFLDSDDFPEEIEPEIDSDNFIPGPAHVWNMFTEAATIIPYTISDKIDLIGSSLDLAEIMGQDLSVVENFHRHLDTLKSHYDLVILDTLPSFGNILASAHRSADFLVIPTELARFSRKGIRLQAQTAKNTVQHFRHDLHLLGIVVNKVTYINRSEHKLLAIQGAYLEALNEQYGDAIVTPLISLSTQIAESQAMAKSLVDYAPSSDATIQFTSLAHQLIGRIEQYEANTHG